MKLLEVKNVTKKFDGLVANNEVSFDLSKGEIVSLIGPNGAGKTTLFNCIAGFYQVSGGQIVFDGKEITNWRPSAVCRVGLARTFQIVKIFNNMTVFENVMVGALNHTADTRKAAKEAVEVLELTGLAPKAHFLGSNLTIADRKRVETARALATKPKLLLLDEVMAGLNSTEVKDAVELLRTIKRQGITLLIVEHVMEAIMPVSDRIIVLDGGHKIAEGDPQVIVHDERVIRAYLGEKYHAQNK